MITLAAGKCASSRVPYLVHMRSVVSFSLHLTVSCYISIRVGQSLSISMDPSIILRCTETSRIYQLKWVVNGFICQQS